MSWIFGISKDPDKSIKSFINLKHLAKGEKIEYIGDNAVVLRLEEGNLRIARNKRRYGFDVLTLSTTSRSNTSKYSKAIRTWMEHMYEWSLAKWKPHLSNSRLFNLVMKVAEQRYEDTTDKRGRHGETLPSRDGVLRSMNHCALHGLLEKGGYTFEDGALNSIAVGFNHCATPSTIADIEKLVANSDASFHILFNTGLTLQQASVITSIKSSGMLPHSQGVHIWSF